MQESDIMKYYVYVYTDPRKSGTYEYMGHTFDFEPFYVGKGCGYRYKEHLYESKIRSGNTSPKNAKIRKLHRLELSPNITIIKHFENENDALDYEKKLISEIGSDFIDDINDGPLVNLVLEVKPPSLKGKTYTEIYKFPIKAEEQRKHRHEKQVKAGGYFKGHKHTQNTKNKIAENTKVSQINGGHNKGRKFGLKTREKQSKIRKEKNSSNRSAYVIRRPDGIIHKVFRHKEYFSRSDSPCLSALIKAKKRGIAVSRGKSYGWELLSILKPSEEEWYSGDEFRIVEHTDSISVNG